MRLPWPYTQGELASMIGGSRQSVNRLLADLAAQGLLMFEGDDLVIPDPRRLAQEVRR
jgi:DNA-binding transcriptional regulator LsrR (DeoR family)